MATVLINGISAKAGGGRSILTNFLSLLHKKNRNEQFIVIVPDEKYLSYSTDNIRIIPVKNSTFTLTTFYFSTIKRLIRKYKVSLIFNLADIIIPVSTNQIYLFDWPYAIYPDSIVWSRMSTKDKLYRRFKLFLTRRYIRVPDLIIAQTRVAEDRLKKYFSVGNIEVIPNAVSLDNLTGGQYKNFGFPQKKIKLLYLTKYYSHKNIEIFIPVARIIRQEKLPFVLILTINELQHGNAKDILDTLKKEALDEIVINVGPVEMVHVPSLYQQSDGLLMPSLLESFSGTYVEAMYHNKPVFTSDLDFAKVVCGDAAFYFDPLNADSIINSLKYAYNNPDEIATKTALGKERLKTFPSWEQVSNTFLTIIEKYQAKE